MAKKQYQPTPPPKSAKGEEVSIEIPQGEFPINFYANLFGIEEVDGLKMVHFGLQVNSRPMGGWAVIFDPVLLDKSKESWLRYLSEVGYPEEESKITFRAPRSERFVPYINVAGLSRTGVTAEIRLFSFCMGDVIEDRRSGHTGKVRGQPEAIVRCSLELQRQFIVALLGDPET
jgi:hypothetical protein